MAAESASKSHMTHSAPQSNINNLIPSTSFMQRVPSKDRTRPPMFNHRDESRTKRA